jgi:hypothetical protein
LLPVSGVALAVREPTSHDELFIVETALEAPWALLELARRVVDAVPTGPIDWARLPAVDLDAVALAIRRAWLGDEISSDATCPDPDCRQRIEVAFHLDDYLGHHRPRRPRRVRDATEDGWFALDESTVRFRVPTVADTLAARTSGEPEAVLTQACVDPPALSRAVARRLDAALSAIAPRLDDLVGGRCPACGQTVSMRFDPLTYTLRELQTLFSDIHRQIHLLAATYGWAEEAILALPRHRRLRYASLIADERSAA